MSAITSILVVIIIIWVAIRSISFAAWNWKNENKTGSVMVVLVSLISLILPVYIIFFKS